MIVYYAVLNNRCLLECKWTVFKNSHPVISCPTDNPPFKSDLRAISLGMNIYSISLLSCRKRLGSRHGTGGPSQPASAAVWFRWNAALLYHGTVSTCEIDTLFGNCVPVLSSGSTMRHHTCVAVGDKAFWPSVAAEGKTPGSSGPDRGADSSKL